MSTYLLQKGVRNRKLAIHTDMHTEITAFTNEKTILKNHGYVCDGNEMYHHHMYYVPTQAGKQTICT